VISHGHARTHARAHTQQKTRMLDETKTATELGESAITSQVFAGCVTSQCHRFSHHIEKSISKGKISSSPWMPTYGVIQTFNFLTAEHQARNQQVEFFKFLG